MNFEAAVYCCGALGQEVKAHAAVRAERVSAHRRVAGAQLPFPPLLQPGPHPQGMLPLTLRLSLLTSIKAVRTIPHRHVPRQPDLDSSQVILACLKLKIRMITPRLCSATPGVS